MPGTRLVLVASDTLSLDELAAVRAEEKNGATIVAWQHKPIVQDRFPCPDVHKALSEQGVTHQNLAGGLSKSLGKKADWELDEAVIHWFKALGRRRSFQGQSFRERARLHGLHLWWWAELYLYHETPLRSIVRDVEALKKWVDQEQPERVVLVHPTLSLQEAAEALCADVESIGSHRSPRVRAARTSWLFLIDWIKMLGTGFKSLTRIAARRDPPAVTGRLRAFFLTHGSMWRKRKDSQSGAEGHVEMYFDQIIPQIAAAGEPILVAFGPPVPFRHLDAGSRLRDLLELADEKKPGELRLRAIREYFSFSMSLRLSRVFWDCLRLWRRLRAGTQLDDWLVHHDVELGGAAQQCVRDTVLRQFPWAIRAYHEVASVLDRERPDVMVLYAESSGLGRAAIQAARDRSVPSVAIQHGIMYPQYYSHEHTRDEIEGLTFEEAVPIPDLTTVFGELAVDLLVERSHYPRDRIVITGGPKFDALVRSAEQMDRRALRKALELDGAPCFVLATRFSAVAPVLRELIEAVESLDAVRLLIKPHQAESVRPYHELLTELSPKRVDVVSGESNLLELLVATDGLVTVDSLASSEALVLGRPVMVVNLPGNLESLVERGCALGVYRGERIRPVLEKLLGDDDTRQALAAARTAYLRDFAYGADGRSTDRIVAAIRQAASRVSRRGGEG